MNISKKEVLHINTMSFGLLKDDKDLMRVSNFKQLNYFFTINIKWTQYLKESSKFLYVKILISLLFNYY